MTVNGSPQCEPHESIAAALTRTVELCKSECLEHVTIRKGGAL